MVIAILSSVIFFLASACFIAVFFLRKQLALDRKLRESLEITRTQIEHYADNLDVLISMLAAIQELALDIPTMTEIDRLAKAVVNSAVKLLNTSRGSLMLLDKKYNRLHIIAARGLSDEVIRTTSVPLGHGVAGRVAEEGFPLFSQDIEKDTRFEAERDRGYTSKSFVSVPIKVKHKVIGVLNVNSHDEQQVFDENDVRLLNILASQTASSIEAIQTYQDIQSTYLGTIQTLAQAVDAKDPYTHHHSDHVTDYAVAIALEMGLSDEMIKDIQYAGMIHDIGKIGIQEEILTKPARLSAAEFDVIKTHPLIGERMIAPIKFLENVAPIILYHHERFDGTGYREGLKGEDIPLGARVISVADAYDAMTTDRPYRAGMDKDAAIEELKRNSGTQFDPKVVEAFIRVLNKRKIYEEKANTDSPQTR